MKIFLSLSETKLNLTENTAWIMPFSNKYALKISTSLSILYFYLKN